MMVSSRFLEFLVALVVCVLALLGALFCIGFLLVEPVRSPLSDSSISIDDALNSSGCAMVLISKSLDPGCFLNGQGIVRLGTCSKASCHCEDQLASQPSCCCHTIREKPVEGIMCGTERTAPTLINTTACGCRSCDNLEVTVELTVKTGSMREPVVAAQVYLMNDLSLTSLGITNNQGRFSYRVSVGVGSIVLSVQAPGFVSHDTGVIGLLPSVPRIERELLLVRSTLITIDNGVTATTVELSPTLTLTIPPRRFLSADGQIYMGPVVFDGMVLDADDEDLRFHVPLPNFVYRDTTTGEMKAFAILSLFTGEFFDTDGLLLNMTGGATLGLVLPEGGTQSELFVVNYDRVSNEYRRVSDFTEVQPFRKKRQSTDTFNFNAQDFDLGTLTLLASLFELNCFLQARAFSDVSANIVSSDGVTITIEQTSFMNGISLRSVIRVETQKLQTSVDGLSNNTVCVTIACTNITTSRLTAEDSITGNSLVAVDFAESVFNDVEFSDVPVAIANTFLFSTVITATSERPRPFYDTPTACAASGNGSNAVTNSSDYFTFEERQLIMLRNNETCFVKVLVRDCLDTTQIITNSFVNGTSVFIRYLNVSSFVPDPSTSTADPSTEEPSTDDPSTTASGDFATTDEFNPDTTDEVPLNQTTPPPTPGPFRCDASRATIRIVCIEYRCSTRVRIRAAADSSTNSLGTFDRDCDLSRTAPFLDSNFFAPLGTTDVLIDTEDLLTSDYNDPNLGLYEAQGDTETARQRCNAGGEATSETIDINNGVTAEFTCYTT